MTVYRCSTCGSWSEELGFTCPRHGRAALTTVERRSVGSGPTSEWAGLRAGLRSAFDRSRQVELPIPEDELKRLVRSAARKTVAQMFPETPAMAIRRRSEALDARYAAGDRARVAWQAAHGAALARIPVTSLAPPTGGPWWPVQMF